MNSLEKDSQQSTMWVVLLTFVIGAIVGTLLDHIHVITNTLSYANPTLAQQPWWVIPEFGIAAIALAFGSALIHERVADATNTVGVRLLIVDCLVFVGFYWASGQSGKYPLGLLGAGVGVWLVLLSLRKNILFYALTGALAAFIGPVCEMLITSTGVFAYTRPDVQGVPIWLPALYLLGAMMMADFVGVMHARRPAQGT